jgi:hypothetical protein
MITNSDEGWVKYSCEKYLPMLLPVLDKYRIVSARTQYERFYPLEPRCWKAAAFADEVNKCFISQLADDDGNISLGSTDVSSDDSSSSSRTKSPAPLLREIISFGDGLEERTAVRIVADQLGGLPKSVMFIQSPTPTQIIGQLNMLTNHMKFVCDNESSLDLEITPKQAEACASVYLHWRNISSSLGNELSDHISQNPLKPTLAESECFAPSFME